MSRHDALMTRARRIDPAAGDAFEGLAVSADGQAMLAAILESPPQRRDQVAGPTAIRRRKLRLGPIARRTIAIGVAAAVVLGIATIGSPDRETRAPRSVWSAELVGIAKQAPRLLLSGAEWRVTRADEFSADSGEMIFENGRGCTLAPAKEGCYWMSLDWRPADTHADYLADRKRGSDSSSKATIDGHQAIVFEYDHTALGTTYQAMWLDGAHSLELRSDVIRSLHEFEAIAATLRQVDVDTWLSAMPESVVTPADRDDAIDRIVADIPIPSNVDLDDLRDNQEVREGEALEYQVVQTVICGWIGQWIDARKAGDEAGVRRAVEAMTGSRDWAAMKAYGGRSYVFDVADAMANGTEVNGNTSLPTGVAYQRHVGCPES